MRVEKATDGFAGAAAQQASAPLTQTTHSTRVPRARLYGHLEGRK